MFIKKMKFKNLKAFNNEVELNFNPNPMQINSDIEDGYFKKINRNTYFSPIYSIGGGNSKGKTSILKIIWSIKKFITPLHIEKEDFFSIYMNEIDLKYKKNKDKNIHEMSKEALDIFFSIRGEFSGALNKIFKIINIQINEIIGDVNINNFYLASSFIKNESVSIIEKIKKSKNVSEEKISNKLLDLILDSNIILKMFEMKFNDIIKSWRKIKHISDDQSYIELNIFDEKEQNEYILKIYDEDNSPKFTLCFDNKKNELSKNRINRIFNYLKSFYFYDFHDIDSSYQYDNLIIELIENLKKSCKLKNNIDGIKKAIEILSIADPTIKNIILKNNNDIKKGIKFLELYDGSNPNTNDISTGTIKFVFLLNKIISSFNENNNFILLIDEIDAFLHIDLVNFFKNLMYESKTFSQIIFTSHNPYALSDNMSNKQIFFIAEENDERIIKKVSSVLSKNKSTKDAFSKKIIGSHPSNSDLNEVMWEILKILPNDYEKDK